MLDLAGYRRLAAPSPRDVAELLAWRSNRERGQLTEALLLAAGLPVARHPYRTVEGGGVNLFVDIGPGPRTLVLASHHDAVPGSPGANDNAASVGILRALGVRLLADPPRELRVRLGFFGGEERAMLGSRAYVRRADLDPLVGVVSLELCGIGDSLALWDVTPALEATPLVRAFVAGVEALGYRRDETYHLAEPVPFFGSDHRPFADRGVPGVGLTAVPRASLEPLRAFIYGGVRGILVPPARRPAPFTTYHTAGDGPETLEPPTLAAVERVLETLVRALDAVPGALTA
jgi:Zn-dependent M28 family amino/carboxypeptidase